MTNTTLQASLESMQTKKKAFELASHNIANADTEGYSKKYLTQTPNYTNNSLQGVRIEAIRTNAQPYLEKDLNTKVSASAYSKIIEQYYQEIEGTLGHTDDPQSLSSLVDKVYIAFRNLSGNPGSISTRFDTINKINLLTEGINSISGSIRDIQFDIDQKISNACEALSADLDRTYILNSQLKVMQPGSVEYAETEDRIRHHLSNISEYIPITYYSDSNSDMIVQTTDGYTLLGKSSSKFAYDPCTSPNEFINNSELNPILLKALDHNGNDLDADIHIVSGGKPDEVSHTLRDGKISALLHLRDTEIPKVIDELDNLAGELSANINRVHNKGSGFPPPSSLTGAKTTELDQRINAQGQARIAVVDESGKAVATGKNEKVPSLLLDLGKLDIGRGPGNINTQAIISEINYHFGARTALDNMVQLDNIDDIKLAASNEKIAPGGTFNLDLEVSNISGKDASISLKNVTATDNLSNNILASFNNTPQTFTSGDLTRTYSSGPSLALNIPATVNYPFTIELEMEVTNKEHKFTETITYTIDSPTADPLNGLYNKRFSAESVTNNSSYAQINEPISNKDILSGKLIATNSFNTVTTPDQPGRLVLQSNDSNWKVVIDEMDSSITEPGLSGKLRKNEGLSYFFGLNDMLIRDDIVSNYNIKDNMSLFFSLRNDIKQNSNYLSTAKLQLTSQSQALDKPQYEYIISKGDQRILQSLSSLESQNIAFDKAGDIGKTTTYFNSYSSQIITISASKSSMARTQKESDLSLKDTLQNKIRSIKAVDLDEELQSTVTYQQIYGASAKLITTANELYQTMIQAF